MGFHPVLLLGTAGPREKVLGRYRRRVGRLVPSQPAGLLTSGLAAVPVTCEVCCDPMAL